MKKSICERWARAIGGNVPVSANKDMIILREQPEVMNLETDIMVYRPILGEFPAQLEMSVDRVSKSLFGVTGHEVDYELLGKPLETTGVDDQRAVDILLGHGLDFRDERGQPLRCVGFLKKQAEAAALGLLGKLPEPRQLDLARWGQSLEQAAREWKKRKSAA